MQTCTIPADPQHNSEKTQQCHLAFRVVMRENTLQLRGDTNNSVRGHNIGPVWVARVGRAL